MKLLSGGARKATTACVVPLSSMTKSSPLFVLVKSVGAGNRILPWVPHPEL